MKIIILYDVIDTRNNRHHTVARIKENDKKYFVNANGEFINDDVEVKEPEQDNKPTIETPDETPNDNVEESHNEPSAPIIEIRCCKQQNKSTFCYDVESPRHKEWMKRQQIIRRNNNMC